jgi:tetratricopeptide (TPR) repeat protein
VAHRRKTREEGKGEEKSSSRRSKGGDDWELWHNSGLCHAYLKQYDEAINAFERANANQRHDATFLQLGKVHEERGDPTSALRVYQDALDFSPESPDLLTTIGLAYLRLDLCGNQPVRRVHERPGTGIATPSSRRRVDGVEDDAMIQHALAVKF